MGSLANCLQRSPITAEDRSAIVARAAELRRAGASQAESEVQAVEAQIAAVKALLKAAAPAASTAQAGQGHPRTVMGSRVLAIVSREVGGLDPAWLSEFSTRFETTRKGKDGKPIIQWRNPMVTGVGKLFRQGGTQDLQLLAEALEAEGYLPAGSVELDAKAAGEKAKDTIRQSLNREEVKTEDEQQAEHQAEQDAERDAYYAALDAESAREAEAERQAIIAESEAPVANIDLLSDDDIPWDAPSTSSDQDAADFLGITVEELHREGLQGSLRQDEQAQAGGRQGDPADAARAAQPPPEARSPAARDGAEEGLTLESQTAADLKAKADREEVAAGAERKKKAAEQERLRKEAEARDLKARADQTVNDFQLGQDAETQMSGIDDMFAEPPAAPAPAPAPASKFAGNTVFTEDAKAKARAILKRKPGQLPNLSRAQPFFSALARTVSGASMNAGPVSAWQSMLKNWVTTGKVKADEVAWTGLDDWLQLQTGKVTKDQVGQFLAANGVQVTETVLGDGAEQSLPDGWQVRRTSMVDGASMEWALFDEDGEIRGEGNTYAEAMQDGWDPDVAADAPTKYSQYTLPGGTNYREVLLTLPAEPNLIENGDGTVTRSGYAKPVYASSHWEQPNVLAHIRLNDRTDADGKRVLFVEEVQSDYGQEGKKKGFTKPTLTQEQRAAKLAEAKALTATIRKRADADRVAGLEQISDETLALNKADSIKAGDIMASLEADKAQGQDNTSRIPAAPFVGKTDAWVALALKRVIKMAVDEGYDKVALITGQQSIDRYWSHPVIEGAVGRWNQVTKPESIRELGEDVLGRKMAALVPLDVVDGGVLAVLKHDQVRKDVVARIPVDVVNVLAKHGFKPEQALRNGDVVLDGLPVDDRGRTATAIGTAIRESSAAIRAKLGGLEPGGRDFKILPALSASDLGPREIAGLLDPVRLFHSGAGSSPQGAAATGSVAETLSGGEGRKGANEQRAAELASLLNAHAEIVHGRNGLLQHGFEAPPSEGMKAFYDKIVPSVAKDVLRKVGGGQMTTVPVSSTTLVTSKTGPRIGRWEETTMLEQPGFDITPAMRDKAATGLPLFRRGGEQSGVPFTELEQSVRAISANWKGQAQPSVVRTAADLPANIVDALRSMNALGSTRGLRMPDGRVFLVADKLGSMEEAHATLFHEVYGHAGLKEFLGDRYEAQMALLRLANPALAAEAEAWSRQNARDEIDARVADGMPRAQAEKIVRALAVEEALADRAGANPPPKVWKALMAKLQEALRAMGLGSVADRLEAMTEAETYQLLMNARKAVQRGAGVHALRKLPEGLQPAASREPPPPVSIETDPDTGMPMFVGDAYQLDYPSIQGEDQDSAWVSYVIMPTGGAFQELGHVTLQIRNGKPVGLSVIKIDGQGEGVGRKVVETVLSAAGGDGITVYTMLPKALGFWRKMGTVIDGEQIHDRPAYEGRTSWALYTQGADGRRVGAAGQERSGSGEERNAGADRQEQGDGRSTPGVDQEGDLPALSRTPKAPVDPVAESAKRKAGLRGARTLSDKVRSAYSKALNNVRDRAELGHAFRQGALDQFHGINRAVKRELGALPTDQDPYITARLANGGTSSVMRALMLHGQARWAANGQHLEKIPDTKGLLDILKPLGNDLNDWFGWMIGNRAARLMKDGRENNLTSDEIKALQALATPERRKAFITAAMQYGVFKRSVLDVAEQAGLIDGDGRKAWDHADYIPFYREIDEKAVFGATGKKGLAGQSSGIRQLKGGEAELNDPMENLLMNFSRLIDASLKNNAIEKTVAVLENAGSDVVKKVGYDMKAAIIPRGQVKKLLAEAGTPDSIVAVLPDAVFDGMAKMWSIQAPTDPSVVRVMRNGSPQFYQVQDPLLLRALTSFVPIDFPGLSVMRGAKRLLTAMVTSTPDFMLRNWIRDSMATQAITRDGVNPLESLRGIGRAWKEAGGYEDMLFAGASFQSGNVNAANPEATAVNMRRALRERGFDASSAGAFMGTIMDGSAAAWERWRQVGESIENANREAVFSAAKAAGRSVGAAAFEAKDLMDFSLRGSSPIYQFLADVLPFFNARTQGLYRLAKSDPKRLLRVGLLMATTTLVLAALNAGRDWYEELPDWDKDTYWHMKLFGMHFRIPKPFELGVLFATLPERIGRSIMGIDSGSKTISRVWTNMRDQLAFDPVPQVFRPALNAWANEDTFRGRPIEGMADEGKSPSARYDARTSDTMRVLAEVADPVSDWSGLSPKKLEYLVNGYFGTVGMYALAVSDAAVRQIGGAPRRPTMRLDDVPIIRSFYAAEPARATGFESDVYKMRADVEQIVREVRALEKDGQDEKANKLQDDNSAKLEVRGEVVGGAKMLSAINKQINQIYRDRDMDPDQKREEVDRLQAEKNKLAKATATSQKVKEAF